MASPMTPAEARAKVPSDPARAVAKMLGKLDDEDRATFNWLVAIGDNHHNAVLCPYCSSGFAQALANAYAAGVQAAEHAKCAGATRDGDD